MYKTMSLAAVLSASVASFAVADTTPRAGGVLNFTAPYGSSFGTLDGVASSDLQEQFVTVALHRALYSWDAIKSEPRLELAESVEVSEDGLTYTYKLKSNAVFHNDKPLSVDDVIFSYQRIADAKNALPGARYISLIEGAEAFAKGEATEISGLKKIDDLTFSITLTSPVNPAFSLMEATTSIYPSNVDPAQQALSPVGLGPFKFKEHVPGSQVVVEKFDKYYEEGKPYLDRVNIIVMADGSARDVAFRNKEVDLTVLGSTQYAEYLADPALKDHILEVAETFTRNIGFNVQSVEPFKDKRVRQAINHAINADLIIQRLLKDKAVRATGWLPVGSPGYNDAAQPYAFDLDKAKALLAEAGYADGFSFEVTATPNESWGVPIVEAIVPMLKRVNIDVKPKPVESAALSEHVSSGNFEAFIWSNISGPDPVTTMRCFWSQTPQSACNNTGYANPEYDAIYEAAIAERDPAKQMELIKQANDFIQEEAPVWFFNYNKAVMAHQPWVHGLVPNANELAIQDYDEIWIDETAPDSRK